jgi:hypothetical protein
MEIVVPNRRSVLEAVLALGMMKRIYMRTLRRIKKKLFQPEIGLPLSSNDAGKNEPHSPPSGERFRYGIGRSPRTQSLRVGGAAIGTGTS